MKEDTLKSFQENLLKHRDDLLKFIETNSPDRDLNLSGAAIKDVLKVVGEVKTALERIDNHTFGNCTLCEGDVETERLHHDFTTQICLAHYTEEEISNLEKDLELTVKVQRQLLPCCVPVIKNFQFAHYIKPAGIVGGDFYDFFTLRDNLQGVVMADVMGKGLPASMLLANLQASIKTLGPEYTNLNDLATKINELFRYNTTLIRFISMCLIGLDIYRNRVSYCNAGHHPPLFWNSNQEKAIWLNPTGPAIGLTHTAKYITRTIDISENDLLILYTDGLVEAKNAEGEEFGEELLLKYVQSNNDQTAENILKGLRKTGEEFAGKFQDDVALLVIKF